MSKAFTSAEPEAAAIPGRAVVRAAPGEERPITAEGHAALVATREAVLVERDEAARAAYTERAARLRAIDHRLALASAALARVRVIDVGPCAGVARFGSTVAFRAEGGAVRRVRLVGPDEAEGTTRVSVLAPLGRALLGARAGSEVEVERPSGVVVLVVEAVE